MRPTIRNRFPTLLLAGAIGLAGLAEAQPERGVTLYAGVHATGPSQTFSYDIADLGATPFGANRARSVDVDPGCTAVLFEYRGYRGRSIELHERDNDLGNTRLGRDTASSLRVDCGGEGWGPGQGRRPRERRGVTLFRDRDLSGPSQTFDRDVPDLSRTPFGSGRASSVDVAPGCVAILFADPFFRGRSTTFREADRNLRNTPVGEDTTASLRVDCGGRGGGRPDGDWDRGEQPWGGGNGGRGAVLYRDRDGRGPAFFVDRDIPDLARTPFGSGQASSIDVTPGCLATLFADPNYRGRSTTFRERDNNLGNTPVGEDTAASIRISCR